MYSTTGIFHLSLGLSSSSFLREYRSTWSASLRFSTPLFLPLHIVFFFAGWQHSKTPAYNNETENDESYKWWFHSECVSTNPMSPTVYEINAACLINRSSSSQIGSVFYSWTNVNNIPLIFSFQQYSYHPGCWPLSAVYTLSVYGITQPLSQLAVQTKKAKNDICDIHIYPTGRKFLLEFKFC